VISHHAASIAGTSSPAGTCEFQDRTQDNNWRAAPVLPRPARGRAAQHPGRAGLADRHPGPRGLRGRRRLDPPRRPLLHHPAPGDRGAPHLAHRRPHSCCAAPRDGGAGDPTAYSWPVPAPSSTARATPLPPHNRAPGTPPCSPPRAPLGRLVAGRGTRRHAASALGPRRPGGHYLRHQLIHTPSSHRPPRGADLGDQGRCRPSRAAQLAGCPPSDRTAAVVARPAGH
jgi:hypothetical protein